MQDDFGSVVLTLWHVSESPGGLADLSKPKLMGGPTPRASESLGLGWDLRICISNRFLGGVDAAGAVLTTQRTTACYIRSCSAQLPFDYWYSCSDLSRINFCLCYRGGKVSLLPFWVLWLVY